MDNIFDKETKQGLQALYEDRQQAIQEGLRPKKFDPYILQIQKVTKLSLAAAWKMVDDMFLQEVAKRYFSE